MKPSIALIDIILFLSIFVPYFLFIRAGRKTKKQKLKAFRNIANTNGLQPELQECWDNNYIGIDPRENGLIFIKSHHQKDNIQVAQFNEVKDCRLVKDHKKIRKGEVKEDVLSLLGIELRFQNQNKAPELLTFYDAASATEENHEVIRAEKWLKLIKDHIGQSKPASAAA